MKTAIYYFIFLYEILSPPEMVFAMAKHNQTILIKNKSNEIFLKRQKRYLVFEKGSTFTGNIAKSIISGYPRGLNEITEYTLVYDLPTEYHVYFSKTTMRPTTTTSTTAVPYHPAFYAHSDDFYGGIKKNMIQRKNFKESLAKFKCYRSHFYDYNKKKPKICLRRTKRNLELSDLTISQRMFYDLMEKWSLIHGFLPRYCFMRTLCESSYLLLPYGYSLLHDIIHILLRYTKPWAFHHKIFGRSLRQHHHIDECAKLYGPYCRVSWLHFITNVVHGSRAADFMR